jgi:pimeloyl-ACP methyl ester carboxylesterase
MKSAVLAVALAITIAGCGGKTKEADIPDAEGDAPFVNRSGFQPTAFSVEVRGKGRPIIFIPGLACPGEIWDDTVERLGEGYEAHILTLAGFAGHKPIKPPLAAKTRKELVRYIRSRHLERPIVVGHSMGGFIAYWLAATAPDVVGGIVVVDAGPALADADDEDARRLRNMWAQSGDDELPVQIKTVYSWMTRKPEKLAPFFDAIAKSDRQTIGDSIYELVTTDVRDQLPAIKAPVLLVLADGSFQNAYRAMVRQIPDHEVVVIPKTRHFVMIDDPAGFTRVLHEFAERVFGADDH